MTPPEGHVAFGLSKIKAPGRDVIFAALNVSLIEQLTNFTYRQSST